MQRHFCVRVSCRGKSRTPAEFLLDVMAVSLRGVGRAEYPPVPGRASAPRLQQAEAESFELAVTLLTAPSKTGSVVFVSGLAPEDAQITARVAARGWRRIPSPCGISEHLTTLCN